MFVAQARYRERQYGAPWAYGPNLSKPTAKQVGKLEAARYRWGRKASHQAQRFELLAAWHAGLVGMFDSTPIEGYWMVDGIEMDSTPPKVLAA